MTFNYALEKKKFDAAWESLRKFYVASGMEPAAIEAMHEYDWDAFKAARIEALHTQELAIPEATADDDEMEEPMVRRYADRFQTEYDTFGGHSRYWWLDDLCLTLPLVGKGHAGSFTGFHRDLSRGCGIIDPVLVRGGLLCYRVGSRFQINGNHTGGIGCVGSDGSTGSILHRKGPAGDATAVGGFLNDLGSTFGFLGNHIEVDRHRVTGGFL